MNTTRLVPLRPLAVAVLSSARACQLPAPVLVALRLAVKLVTQPQARPGLELAGRSTTGTGTSYLKLESCLCECEAPSLRLPVSLGCHTKSRVAILEHHDAKYSAYRLARVFLAPQPQHHTVRVSENFWPDKGAEGCEEFPERGSKSMCKMHFCKCYVFLAGHLFIRTAAGISASLASQSWNVDSASFRPNRSCPVAKHCLIHFGSLYLQYRAGQVVVWRSVMAHKRAGWRPPHGA